ncbi:MAG: polysaccharide export protein [Hyphomicrobiaceae bacterium]|nr:polysaccharide export protein [Hyphomicrobiaceae bacterium]
MFHVRRQSLAPVTRRGSAFCSKASLLLAATMITGCSHLPVAGPDYRDINSSAAVHLASDRRQVTYDYALVDVSPVALDVLSQIGDDSLHATFSAEDQGAPNVRVGVGDVLQVSVFESATGGLFLPADTGPRPANFVTMPNQSVTRAGNISVPYAGSIRAAGRTVPEIQHDIERKLAGRAVEPQVVVSVVDQNASAVSVLGDTLNGSNQFKLSGSGERIIDLISRAGGTKYPGYELFVTLQRHGRRATVHFPRLISDPEENVFVQPGDTIYVSRKQQKFVAVGALGTAGQDTGVTGQFKFDQEHLSLIEALAKAGGLLDTRANPAQVFVYRIEHREALERIGVDLRNFASDQNLVPTVYRANFRDPASFFAAQKFPMRDEDLIYAANSDATEVVKFLGYVRSVTSTVAGVSNDAAFTRDVFLGRHLID